MTEEVWQERPSTTHLPNDQVHVWAVNLDQTSHERDAFWQTFTEEEQNRAERFYFEHDKFHFIVARGVLRQLLASYLDILPGDVTFAYGHNGKPELARGHHSNGRILQFNLSHTRGMGLIGVSWNRMLGVDIERVRPLEDGPNIAKRFFSKWEVEQFFALPEALYPQAFFNCWTRKEAFIKAIGDGLTYPLANFDVTLQPGQEVKLIRVEGSRKKAEKWRLISLEPADGYVGAVIAEGKGWRVNRYRW